MRWERLRRLFQLAVSRPETIRRAVDDEVDFHLSMRIDELTRLGRGDTEARAEATRRFGDVAAARAALVHFDGATARRRARVGWVADLWQDLRFAARELGRQRSFALLAIATLSLGIGLATSIVSLYDRLSLHPLPYRNADRLAEAWLITKVGEHSMRLTFDDEARRAFAGTPGIERIDGYRSEVVTADFPAGPEPVASRAVTPSLLAGLGARIVLGRGVVADDTLPSSPPVVVVAGRTWRARFGGRKDVVGSSLRIGPRVATVVGVLESGFDLTAIAGGGKTELWLPLRVDQPEGRNGTVVLLTLAPRARPAEVEAAIERRFRASRDTSDPVVRSFTPVLQTGRAMAESPATRTFGLLLAAVGLVLLVACGNVAALLLGQAVGRFQEFGVRSALGAGRRRVIRQLMTESGLLGALGALGGLLVTVAVLALARRFRPDSLLTIDEVRVDGVALGAALAVATVAVGLFGLAPIWAVARTDLATALVGRSRRSLDGRGAGRLRSLLVIAQVAMTLMLLSGAGLLLKSFGRERNLPLGYQADGLATVRLRLPRADFPDPTSRDQAAVATLERVRAVRGVRQITLAGSPITDYGVIFGEFLAEDRPLPATETKSIMPTRWVGPEYFAVTGLPLVAGRPIGADTTQRELIIDEATARRVWGTIAVTGRRVRFSREGTEWSTVVGVAGNVRDINSAFDGVPVLYDRMPRGEESVALLIRVADEAVIGEVTRTIRAVNPAIRISAANTALQSLDQQLASTRFTMAIVGWFAALALALAIVGLYGVVASTVRQRHFEFGIRLALGAPPARVTGMVVAEGLGRVGLGVGLGLAGAGGLVRLLRGFLYQMSPWDPVVFFLAAGGLGLVALTAVWVPARRASRVDPLEAVRSE